MRIKLLAIPVGKGDKLSAEVYAKYEAVTSSPNTGLTALGSMLITAITGGSSMINEFGQASINNSYTGTNGSIIGTSGFAPDQSGIYGFLNVLFISTDDDVNVDASRFAFDQISSGAQQIGTTTKSPHDLMSIQNFEAPSNGIAIIYVSNEQNYQTNIYFDDLKVTVNEHPVVQSDNYYPFGLSFNSYQRVTSRQNDYLYNGKELQDELDLNWLDYGARMYMPDIGRWGVIDPMADKFLNLTPYSYAASSPIVVTDPDGRDISFTAEYQRDDNGEIVRDKDGNANLIGLTMTVTGKVVNTTNQDVDLDQAASDISGALESSFNGDINGVKFTTETNITAASSMDEVSDSDHVFALAEMGNVPGTNESPLGVVNDFGGKVAFVDVDLFQGPIDSSYGNQGERTAAHEFGHLAQLRHKNRVKDNLMRQGGNSFFGYNFSTKITSDQLNSIIYIYKHNPEMLNRGKNYEMVTKGRRGTNRVKMPRRGRASSVVKYK